MESRTLRPLNPYWRKTMWKTRFQRASLLHRELMSRDDLLEEFIGITLLKEVC